MWGVSDFLGGLTSRRLDALRVATLSVPLGVVPLTLLAFLIPGTISTGVLWVGLGAGIAGVGGILLLYMVLAAGPMGVVSPLTAVVSAVVPVAVGLLLGERPSIWAYLGMVLAVAAIVMVSLEPDRDDDAAHRSIRPRTLVLAVACGLLIGAYMSLIGTAPDGSGVWPVLLSRIVSAVLVVGYACARMRRSAFLGAALVPAIGIGTLDAVANAVFRLAAQSGMLAVVSVLAALYPAATVLLARFYLHERLRPLQQVGMLTALGAAGLLALT